MKKHLVLILLCAINYLHAQQAPVKTKTSKPTPAKTTKATPAKSTKQAPAKKTTAKKTTKAPKKDAMVFICEGTNGYTYHSRRTCAILAKCNGKIREVSKSDAVYSYGKEPCKNCN